MGGGLILRVWLEIRDGHPVSGWLRGEGGGAGSVFKQDGRGLEIVGGHHGQGGVQAPADRLYGTVEVRPEGVVFCAERHPGYRGSVIYCGVCAVRSIPTGTL